MTEGDKFVAATCAASIMSGEGAASRDVGVFLTHYYRCLEKMSEMEAAVKEAGSLRQADVIAALDHARIAQGPGGAAAMVPGQHHVRMHMYIAQSTAGQFRIVKSLGATDPNEREVATTASPLALAV